MKELIKRLIKQIPIAFTQNQRYDKQTNAVIKKVCNTYSNCIDVGCHKGEVLDIMLRYAPKGKHYAFEPIPDMAESLKMKYNNCSVFQIALSNQAGKQSFNYVISNPAYSGLIKRKYDRENEVDQSIEVETATLDSIIPDNVKVDLIKIDVEGGELLVLEGSKDVIKRSKPIIIFEHGLGASEFYNSSPDKIFDLLSSCGLKISTMKQWLKSDKPFSLSEFSEQFYKRKNYYFIAYA